MSSQKAHDEEITSFEFWNDLPNELKLECIKKMTFMARINLKLAAKSEKALVELIKEKYRLDCVHIFSKACYYNGRLKTDFNLFAATDENGMEVKIESCSEDESPRVANLFECCEVDKLTIETRGFGTERLQSLEAFLRSDLKLDVAEIEISFHGPGVFDGQMLSKCDSSKLKKIVFNEYPIGRMDKLLALPDVVNVESIHFTKEISGLTEAAEKLVENWKIKDYPNDREAIFDQGEQVFRFLLREASFRHTKKKAFSIPTLNNAKLIWIFQLDNYDQTIILMADSEKTPDFEALEKKKDQERNLEKERLEKRKRNGLITDMDSAINQLCESLQRSSLR